MHPFTPPFIPFSLPSFFLAHGPFRGPPTDHPPDNLPAFRSTNVRSDGCRCRCRPHGLTGEALAEKVVVSYQTEKIFVKAGLRFQHMQASVCVCRVPPEGGKPWCGRACFCVCVCVLHRREGGKEPRRGGESFARSCDPENWILQYCVATLFRSTAAVLGGQGRRSLRGSIEAVLFLGGTFLEAGTLCACLS